MNDQMPFSPKDYDELLDYFSEEERLDYVRLTMQVANGHITEEFFNAKHDELFQKVAKRKEELDRYNAIKRTDKDEISMKLYGGVHSDYGIKKKLDKINGSSFIDRYKRKMQKKEDTRQVSTFYDV